MHQALTDPFIHWQVKQERALQEQASTYLQLVCSACDLSEKRVRDTAASVQQIKLQVRTYTFTAAPVWFLT